jgi:hypothetical protein
MREDTRAQVRLILQTGGEFWNEAAVLVAVFSLLEKILRLETLPSKTWALGTLVVSVLTFVLGVLLKIWGKK